jgi:hypothetical protein
VCLRHTSDFQPPRKAHPTRNPGYYKEFVTPVKTGIQAFWIPAFAGMTETELPPFYDLPYEAGML